MRKREGKKEEGERGGREENTSRPHTSHLRRGGSERERERRGRN